MGISERLKRLGFRINDRLVDATAFERIGIAIASLVLALLIASLIVWASGSDPVVFLRTLVVGAFGTRGNISLSLRQSTMLILAGVSVAIAFKAGIFNIGVQGQMVTGGFATALAILGLAPHFPASPFGGLLVIVIATLVGMVAGGLYAAIPGLMKAYAEANEVVTTIMLNFIASGVIYYVVLRWIDSPNIAAEDVTPAFPSHVSLPSIVFDDSSFSILGLLVALLTAVIVYVVFRHTFYGYDLRISGKQRGAAMYSGVETKRQIVSVMFFSGMVAGLTGAVFVIMVLGLFRDPRSMPTFGFDAIAVSLIAANNPLGVIPAGVLFGGLSSAKVIIDIQLNISKELVDGIVGIIVLFVAMPEFFKLSFGKLRERVPLEDPAEREDED